jgi:hypothetical protein
MTSDPGPRDLSDKLAQATPDPSASDAPPHLVSRAEVATPRETRPLPGFDGAVPKASASAAAGIPIEPPPVASPNNPAPSGDATAGAPSPVTSGPPANLPINSLPTQDLTVADVKAEAYPALASSEAPRPPARPLATVPNGTGGAPEEIDPPAPPVRPTPAPAGAALARASPTVSFRPSPASRPAAKRRRPPLHRRRPPRRAVHRGRPGPPLGRLALRPRRVRRQQRLRMATHGPPLRRTTRLQNPPTAPANSPAGTSASPREEPATCSPAISRAGPPPAR